MSKSSLPGPIDPAGLALHADGAMRVQDARELFREGSRTVKQVAKETGLSRSELFALMAEGVLPWTPKDAKGTRIIPWSAVVDYLARLYAAHKQTTGAASRA